jgi:hypothetical protein
MEHQSDINSAMRTILIEWLIEVTDEYKLLDETLFLCVQYIDRFLSTVNVTRSKLQLLGLFKFMQRKTRIEFSFFRGFCRYNMYVCRIEI